jgi:small subunit ribosomal protein S2
MIDFEKLIKAGVHFGHQRTRRCPKMDAYIWGLRNDVQLIDVSKTAFLLEQAAKFLETTAAEGKTILWVGTKKSARDIVKKIAQDLDMPSVTHRWIGGTLSNYDQVKKSITKLLHYEDILSKTDKSTSLYTKKEFNTFQKIVERLNKSVGGIRKLKWPVGAIILVDARKERSALKEAASMGVPIVALVDTDSDPSMVDYVIPANDDAPRAITVLMEYLAEYVRKGKEVAAKAYEEAKKAGKVPTATTAEHRTPRGEDLAKKLLEEDPDLQGESENRPAAGRGKKAPFNKKQGSFGGQNKSSSYRPRPTGGSRPSNQAAKKSE